MVKNIAIFTREFLDLKRTGLQPAAPIGTSA
jgi:hypothetical protein